jgi:hypothetical protein
VVSEEINIIIAMFKKKNLSLKIEEEPPSPLPE